MNSYRMGLTNANKFGSSLFQRTTSANSWEQTMAAHPFSGTPSQRFLSISLARTLRVARAMNSISHPGAVHWFLDYLEIFER